MEMASLPSKYVFNSKNSSSDSYTDCSTSEAPVQLSSSPNYESWRKPKISSRKEFLRNVRLNMHSKGSNYSLVANGSISRNGFGSDCDVSKVMKELMPQQIGDNKSIELWLEYQLYPLKHDRGHQEIMNCYEISPENSYVQKKRRCWRTQTNSHENNKESTTQSTDSSGLLGPQIIGNMMELKPTRDYSTPMRNYIRNKQNSSDGTFYNRNVILAPSATTVDPLMAPISTARRSNFSKARRITDVIPINAEDIFDRFQDVKVMDKSDSEKFLKGSLHSLEKNYNKIKKALQSRLSNRKTNQEKVSLVNSEIPPVSDPFPRKTTITIVRSPENVSKSSDKPRTYRLVPILEHNESAGISTATTDANTTPSIGSWPQNKLIKPTVEAAETSISRDLTFTVNQVQTDADELDVIEEETAPRQSSAKHSTIDVCPCPCPCLKTSNSIKSQKNSSPAGSKKSVEIHDQLSVRRRSSSKPNNIETSSQTIPWREATLDKARKSDNDMNPKICTDTSTICRRSVKEAKIGSIIASSNAGTDTSHLVVYTAEPEMYVIDDQVSPRSSRSSRPVSKKGSYCSKSSSKSKMSQKSNKKNRVTKKNSKGCCKKKKKDDMVTDETVQAAPVMENKKCACEVEKICIDPVDCQAKYKTGLQPILAPQRCFPDTCGRSLVQPLEIRYAYCLISKFEDYTVYEVMKSSKTRPKKMPRLTEGVFVVKGTNISMQYN